MLAFTSEGTQSHLGVPLPYTDCANVLAAYFGNYFLTQFSYIRTFHILSVRVFKGETTKKANIASEAPGSKPKEAPKNSILFKF